MKKKLALEIICAMFILLFTYAAAMKLMDTQKFGVQMSQSPILENYASFLAWAVPISELLIGCLLVWVRFRLIGLYASFTLMAVFTMYIIAILQFSYKIPCSCGGILESMGWTEHLIFNIGFAFLAVAGIVLYHSEEESNNPVLA